MEFIDALPSDEESCHYTEHLEFHPDFDSALASTYSDDELAEVLPYCPNVTSALLSGIRGLSSRTLILLAENASRLGTLDLSGCLDITDLGLRAIATHSTSLTALAVNRIPGITDHALAALVRGLPRLEHLEMDSLPLVTAASVRDIWTFARGLRRWTLSGCLHLTDAGFPWVSERGDSQARPNSEGRPRNWTDRLPPLTLPASHKMNELRVLDLSHCFKLTDGAVLGLVAHAPRMHQLSLAGCVKLTDRSLHALCGLGRHLDTLDIGGLANATDAGVVAIANACLRLQVVDISFMKQLTDLAVLALSGLERLRSLAAGGLPKVTDQALFALAEHGAALSELHFPFCPKLTLEGVKVVVRRLGGLEELGLSGVPALRRQGIRRFSELPPTSYEEKEQGAYRVFRHAGIRALHEFLEKEEWRKRECERKNILYHPRGDDSRALY
ncbi:RNI-like protein [Epithele typhae]|uniref:RNI-like protein n=1 Tax=Epithele typhae TaxID=378194 RepID=UPI00200756C5|nr:RNI-like protein [Epithele typhae]KAH9943157.1 RNI-like protein [Epithele typhae]